ncbi:MAG: GNAT family N-acetyltransferase [Bacilli bacterium]|jgi:predicted GNAT family N-acyltransferase|nr:GNAT family N-acetyltransferase [Bacilli bacterium]
MEIEVRPASIGDSIRVFELIKNTSKSQVQNDFGLYGIESFWPTTVTLARISSDLIDASRGRKFFVATYFKTIVGVIVAVTKGPDLGKIIALSVEKNFNGQDIEQKLLGAITEFQKQQYNQSQYIEVFESQHELLTFLTQVGFVEVNRRPLARGGNHLMTSIILKRTI